MRDATRVRFRNRLLSWYRRHKRDLPWRREPSPYRVWVSETMLQQTTVATVIPYFERFIREFPDIRSLAEAPEASALKAWAGLGYYSRARNLRLAARKIMAEHGGRFPKDLDGALSLPGIGRYTAGAALSIAFQKPYTVVDGNVARVFSRISARNFKSPAPSPRLWAMAEKLLDRENPGDWNQALMELGATVCLPRNPNCPACPISKFCRAFKTGRQADFPAPKSKPRPMNLRWTVLWIEKNGRVLIWKRGGRERFLKNHWGLPEPRHLGVRPGMIIKTARHTITHHKIKVDVAVGRAPIALSPQARWVPRKNLGGFLVSSLWEKCAPKDYGAFKKIAARGGRVKSRE